MKGSSQAASHKQHIAEVEEKRRAGLQALHVMVREEAPGLEPTMDVGWLGCGTFHSKYTTGREGDWMKIGIANKRECTSLCCCAGDGSDSVAERSRERVRGADIEKSRVHFKRLRLG